MSDNLVPEPESSVFDTVNKVLGDEEAARRVMANPNLVAVANGPSDQHAHGDGACACGGHGDGQCCQSGEDDIPLKAVDDIGRATAADVKEALHQVIDPELGIDVIDLGLVYGIEIDELGRAIITMTLTTPACPLTDLIEDECASTLAGLVDGQDHAGRPRAARRAGIQLRQHAKVLSAFGIKAPSGEPFCYGFLLHDFRHAGMSLFPPIDGASAIDPRRGITSTAWFGVLGFSRHSNVFACCVVDGLPRGGSNTASWMVYRVVEGLTGGGFRAVEVLSHGEVLSRDGRTCRNNNLPP